MKKTFRFILSILAILIPIAAKADAGVPMLALIFPEFYYALIPVIMVEAYFFKRAGFSLIWSLKWNTIANIITTFAGVPLTWCMLFGLEILAGGDNCHSLNTLPQKIFAVFMEAAWLCPYQSALRWMVPTAFLILLVPFFLISWKIESLVLRKMNKQFDSKLINKTSLKANLFSYFLLALYPASLFFTL